MNRLVIIGNGFDLAHGLPTGYGDFINNYWKGVFSYFININAGEKNIYEDNLIKFEIKISSMYLSVAVQKFKEVKTYTEFENFLNYINEYNNRNHGFLYKLSFENNFFKRINSLNSIQNWVDIENEYFKF